MIIKSHILNGYRKTASYLEAQGKNEIRRTVEISDIDAETIEEAFWNMWAIGCHTEVQKSLHHISINPRKEETLSDKQVFQIIACCEEKYGYKTYDHQRVIVEHVRNGRQHFHVVWNRIGLLNGRAVNPGCDHKKSIQAAREMERKLGLLWIKSKHTDPEEFEPKAIPVEIPRPKAKRYSAIEEEISAILPDNKIDGRIFATVSAFCTKRHFYQ